MHARTAFKGLARALGTMVRLDCLAAQNVHLPHAFALFKRCCTPCIPPLLLKRVPDMLCHGEILTTEFMRPLFGIGSSSGQGFMIATSQSL